MHRVLPLLVLILAVPLHAQAPRVSSVSPLPNAIGADPAADIVLQFDEALAPASVTGETVRVFGRWSGPAAGTLALENGNQTIRFTPAEAFSAGETVMVSVSKGITDTAGTPLATPFAFAYWADAGFLSDTFAVGPWLSIRQPGEGNIISYGAYAGDLNDDGYTDLAVPNEAPADVRVFLNDGAGGYDEFTVFPLPNGSFPSTNEGADLDGDGRIDMVVGNGGNTQMSVLMGDGTGDFSSVTSYPTTGNGVRGLAVLDADGDGQDDVMTANRFSNNLSFFRGLGTGAFATPITLNPGGTGETALAAADANGDGITDLFVGALNSGEVILLLGDGDGGFTVSDRIDTAGAPWMLAAGDVNGDGHVDVVSAGAFGNVVDVVLGDGAGGLGPGSSLPSGQFTIAIDLGDLDGDGDLDLVSSNYTTADFYVFLNDGDGTFGTPQILSIDGAGSCAVLHDRDNDGVLDITAIDEVDDRLYFMTHIVPPSNEPGAPETSLALDVVGNPFFGGARLRVQLAERTAVRLVVYDALGREVAVVLDETLPAGERVVPWSAGGLPAGVYLARLEAESATATARLTRLR